MNKFKETISNIRLSEREKSQMMSSIIGTASPFQKYFYFSYESFVKVTASFLVVFFVAGGTVSAFAEKAIPGESLYTVKTGVNEKIAGALAVSTSAKAEHETGLVVRRLEEVEKVLTKEDITDEKKEEIVISLTEDITEHRENVSLEIDKMLEEGDVAEAVSASSELGGALDVHADVISLVANDPAVADLADSVVLHVEKEGETVEEQKNTIMEDPAIETEDVLRPLIKDLKNVLRDERENFDKTYSKRILDSVLVIDIKEEAENEESIARDLEEDARDADKLGDSKLALDLYTSSVEHYKRANLLLEIADNFPDEKEVEVTDPVVDETVVVPAEEIVVLEPEVVDNTTVLPEVIDTTIIPEVSTNTEAQLDPVLETTTLTTESMGVDGEEEIEAKMKFLLPVGLSF